jgi:hypothetical protein
MMRKLGPLAIAFSCLIVAACGGDESPAVEKGSLPTAPESSSAQTFSGEGYSLSHPSDWEWSGEIPGSGLSHGASLISQVMLAPRTDSLELAPEVLRVEVSSVPHLIENAQWDEGVDPQEHLDEVADVPRRVTADNLEEFADWRVPELMEAYAPSEVREGPYAATIDGLPVLYLVAEGSDVNGEEIISETALVFDGETEYAIACEYAPAKEDDMRPGCALVFDTFQLE